MLARAEVTKRIKTALFEKTGIRFSVTGSTGTAYNWITITAPKGRRVKNILVSKGLDWHDDVYEQVASPDGYYMSSADQEILKNALGIDYTYNMEQGLSFDYSDWGYWLEKAEKANPFEIETEEVEEVEEVVYDIPEITEEKITLEEWQIQVIPSSDITTKAQNGDFLQVNFPHNNKQGWLVDYNKQLESTEKYSTERCIIEMKVLLTQTQYDQYVWSLLSYQDWLDGKGGTDSLNFDKLPKDTKTWSSTDWDVYREGAYSHVVLIESFQREPLFVNPEGYTYARYVGFASDYISDTDFNRNGNVDNAAIEIESIQEVLCNDTDIEIDEVAVTNPMIALAVNFIRAGKSYGEVLNILTSTLGISAALDMVKDAMVIIEA